MTITAGEKAALDQLAADQSAGLAAIAKASPAGSPVRRAARGTGQAATAYVLLDLAQAFNWAGSATWTTSQWKAVTAAAVAVVGAAQNFGPPVGRAIVGWWKSHRAGG